METNTVPKVAVMSCSNMEPVTIIKMLEKCTKINKVLAEKDHVYSWTIDTKYYTADVNIHAVEKADANVKLDSVEAVVVHFDSKKESGLNDLRQWEAFIDTHQPEIRILLADDFSNTAITKRRATAWCLETGFELIELNPSDADEEEEPAEDEIIKETKGVERIIEALQTHMWSNLVMKPKGESYDPSNFKVFGGLPGEYDDGDEEFNGLFQRLHMVKESVQSMPIRERRQCAEQVVAAFWRAIGGDEGELEDL